MLLIMLLSLLLVTVDAVDVVVEWYCHCCCHCRCRQVRLLGKHKNPEPKLLTANSSGKHPLFSEELRFRVRSSGMVSGL
jgi:hypothetical protein